jgi:ectoine hydroxylase-related dioxygenase (phytanoyl-CoA dioxygenase family)
MDNLIRIENLVNAEIQDAIENFVTSTAFRWYYSPGTIVLEELDEESKKFVVTKGINPHQFMHTIIKDSKQHSEFFNLIQPIIENLADNLKTDIEIIRVKFNFLSQNADATHHYPHTDTNIIDSNIKTMIYYVNDTDGDTYLFNEVAPLDNDTITIKETINPKKGSAVIFDASTLHAGSSPVVHTTRIALNVVFKII